jgi:phosphoglycerate dehydrogenase-like enzyme
VSKPRVLVTFSPTPDVREGVLETLQPLADVEFLSEVPDHERAERLRVASAIFAWFVERELRGPEELSLLKPGTLVQLLSAGVDHVPFDWFSEEVEIASNAGAYAEPMAEHVVAMALALAKRLPQNDAAMARGEFDQQRPNRAIRGAVVGVLGFGGVGQATARLFKALDARVYALNRSGRSDEPIDQLGTLEELDQLLTVADILVVSLPLTRETRGLIGRRELSLMTADAILVNVARAEIIDEDALYEHLRQNPSFSAGLDVWWQEPAQDGLFATRRPFLELPNVLGSPHNSGITVGALAAATRDAAANIARYLRGEGALHVVDRSEYVG